MKKSATNEHLTAWEADIRKDEREKVFAIFDKRLTDVSVLANNIFKLVSLAHEEPTTKTTAPAPKRAVTADETDIMLAFAVLSNTKPPYSALSPKNVAAVWSGEQGAYRIAGAALKALVADGRAVVKRGKYAQKQPEVEVGSDGNLASTDSAGR